MCKISSKDGESFLRYVQAAQGRVRPEAGKRQSAFCNQHPDVFLCQAELGLTGNMKVLKHYCQKRTQTPEKPHSLGVLLPSISKQGKGAMTFVRFSARLGNIALCELKSAV